MINHITFVSFFLSIIFVFATARQDPFIYGGYYAKEGQFPYQAYLKLENHSSCCGAILNSRWVVTADHCVVDILHYIDELRLIYGTINKNEGIQRNLMDIVLYEPRNEDKLYHDIALLKVTEDIEFNDLVQPISISGTYLQDNVPVTVCGWGKTEFGKTTLLMCVNLTAISNEKCIKLYDFGDGKQYITKNHVCAESPVGVGTCMGDSGSPLVYNGEIVGIAIFVYKCGSLLPDGFERVSIYKDWIEGIINEN